MTDLSAKEFEDFIKPHKDLAGSKLYIVNETSNDIDVCVSIPDSTSRVLAIELLSSYFYMKSIKNGKLITFTPVRQCNLEEGSSAFIVSIKKKMEELP